MSDQKMMGGKFVGVEGATEQDMLDGIDPGVRRLVAWLRANGFNTTDSGDGKTKFAQGFTTEDGVCEWPHVVIVFDKHEFVAEVDRLGTLLWDEHKIELFDMGPEETNEPRLDASYCFASQCATAMLLYVDDSMLAETSPP